jgi:hypothetical protein
MLGRLCTPRWWASLPQQAALRGPCAYAAATRASIPLHAVHAVGSSGILQVRVDRSAHAMVDCKLYGGGAIKAVGQSRIYACATGALSGAGVMSVGLSQNITYGLSDMDPLRCCSGYCTIVECVPDIFSSPFVHPTPG